LEKFPLLAKNHEKIIFLNFIIKFTGIVAILLGYMLKHLLYVLKLLTKSGPTYPPDNKKNI
jgi:hypothetical protein